MSPAWVLPLLDQSTLCRVEPASPASPDAPRAPPRLVEVCAVPMPAMAPHVLDLDTDTLVYAHQGALAVVRGLQAGAPSTSITRVELPGAPKIHALALLDGVVYTGAAAGKGSLGLVDLRAELRWQPIRIKGSMAPGKAIDGFAIHEQRLIAVDDFILPRYLIVYDVADPRAPAYLDTQDLPEHSTYESVVSVAQSGPTLLLLSLSMNHGWMADHLSWLDLAALKEWAVLTATDVQTGRRVEERLVDFRAVALAGDRALIAAGRDGIGVVRAPRRPPPALTPMKKKMSARKQPVAVALDQVRFVPVDAGPVVGVVPVDEAHAIAIVAPDGPPDTRRATQGPYDAALVALPP